MVKKRATKKKVSTKKAPTKKITKKPITKKKVTKKKVAKKIKENEFKVALKSDEFNVSTEKDTIQADNVDDVLDDIEGEDYDTVIIKKQDSHGSKPKTAPTSAIINNKPDGLGESFNIKKYTFPYTIALPVGFKSVITSCMLESKNHVILESGSRFTIRFNNKKQLSSLMSKLSEQSDNQMVATIMDGIIRSVV